MGKVRYLPLAAAWAIAVWSQTLVAQQSEQANVENQVLEEVHVTGTRISGRDFASPSPVFTVGKETLQLEGLPTLESHLNRLPQFSPSFDKTSTNPGRGQSTINLRGLGTNRNLVLLDGRRLGPSSVDGVIDINSLPTVMVERIEVLTGGASAVYGSDAMSGVVNFITRDDFEGLEISGNYEESDESDAEIWSVNAAGGSAFAGGRGHISGFVDYMDRDPVLSPERSFSQVQLIDDWDTGELTPFGSTANAAGVLNPFFNPSLGFITYTAEGNPRPFEDPADRYNFFDFTYLQTGMERTSARILMDYEVSDALSAQLELLGSATDMDRQIAPPPVFGFYDINLDNPLLTDANRQLLTENFQVLGNGFAQLPLRRRMVDTGPRVFEDDSENWRAGINFDGRFGPGWTWSFSYHYTEHNWDTKTLNALSASRFEQALLVDPATGQCFDPSGGCVAANVFGPGNISPEAAEFLRVAGVENESEVTMHLATLTAETAFDTGLVEDLGVAVGLEWRDEEGSFDPDPALFTNDVIGTGADDSVNGDFDVGEVFVEFYQPLLRGNPFASELSLEAGARYADHSEAGDIWSYKGGLSWAPTASLRFRGMFQRAVRAPNLTEMFTVAFNEPGLAADFTGQVNDPCSASADPVANGNTELCVAQGIPTDQLGIYEADPFYLRNFARGGNTDLDPEEADTWTAGLVWEPEWSAGLSVALDWYQIDIDDAIEFISGDDAILLCFDIGAAQSEFCNSFTRAADGNIDTQLGTYRNLARIKAEGVDLQIDYSFELAGLVPGEFGLSFIGNWNRQTSFQADRLTPAYDCEGLFGFPCDITSFGTFPEYRSKTALSYTLGPVDAQLQWQWIDSMDNAISQYPEPFIEFLGYRPGIDQVAVEDLDSENYLDLHLGWQATDKIRVIAGVNNVTDNKPPLMGDQSQQNNTDPSMYDVIGRRYHLSFTWRM